MPSPALSQHCWCLVQVQQRPTMLTRRSRSAWIVSFAAGGPTDIVARIMGARMGEILGQQFIVENKTGAGGNIGADVVAKSPPDGYTLLMATVSTHAINPGLYRKFPDDPRSGDFAPIGQVGVTPIMLVAHPSVPATDVQEPRSAWPSSTRTRFTYGSSGVGSILHLCRRAIQLNCPAASISQHVPYRGSSSA